MRTTTATLTLTALALLLGCEHDLTGGAATSGDAVPQASQGAEAPLVNDGLIHIVAGPFNWVLDENGDEATDPSTPLFHRDPLDPDVVIPDDLVPLLAPDGHHVTLGEYTAVEGRARVKCVREGTHLNVHLSGLLPKGVYTLWLALWDPPLDPALSLEELLPRIQGLGAAGPADGSQNAFQASASGEGQVTLVIPEGPLSLFGEVTDPCLFDDPNVAQWHIIGAYHTDDMTHGPLPGPRVEPFLFIFDN